MVVSAGWYIALVSLWPADSRPYIAGSTDNSLLQLAFGYNGIERIAGNEGGGPGRRTRRVGPVTVAASEALSSSAASPASAGCSARRWAPRRPGCCPPPSSAWSSDCG